MNDNRTKLAAVGVDVGSLSGRAVDVRVAELGVGVHDCAYAYLRDDHFGRPGNDVMYRLRELRRKAVAR
ncbi:MAG TPA: hypothetical protein VEL02_00830 [Jatrophihabitantaceae bacterium]|nr:hypothetical protein [Jatrophihabitantaceae bacterium]